MFALPNSGSRFEILKSSLFNILLLNMLGNLRVSLRVSHYGLVFHYTYLFLSACYQIGLLRFYLSKIESALKDNFEERKTGHILKWHSFLDTIIIIVSKKILLKFLSVDNRRFILQKFINYTISYMTKRFP